MSANAFRFEFDRAVPLDEAEMTLHLALLAVEGLYGQARVRTEVGYSRDEPGHAILVDGATPVGTAVVQIFTSLGLREFGETAFQVRRIPSASSPQQGPDRQEPSGEPARA